MAAAAPQELHSPPRGGKREETAALRGLCPAGNGPSPQAAAPEVPWWFYSTGASENVAGRRLLCSGFFSGEILVEVKLKVKEALTSPSVLCGGRVERLVGVTPS